MDQNFHPFTLDRTGILETAVSVQAISDEYAPSGGQMMQMIQDYMNQEDYSFPDTVVEMLQEGLNLAITIDFPRLLDQFAPDSLDQIHVDPEYYAHYYDDTYNKTMFEYYPDIELGTEEESKVQDKIKAVVERKLCGYYLASKINGSIIKNDNDQKVLSGFEVSIRSAVELFYSENKNSLEPVTYQVSPLSNISMNPGANMQRQVMFVDSLTLEKMQAALDAKAMLEKHGMSVMFPTGNLVEA